MKIILREAQVKKIVDNIHNEWKEIDDKLIRV
jgi:hypothetical protein